MSVTESLLTRVWLGQFPQQCLKCAGSSGRMIHDGQYTTNSLAEIINMNMLPTSMDDIQERLSDIVLASVVSQWLAHRAGKLTDGGSILVACSMRGVILIVVSHWIGGTSRLSLALHWPAIYVQKIFGYNLTKNKIKYTNEWTKFVYCLLPVWLYCSKITLSDLSSLKLTMYFNSTTKIHLSGQRMHEVTHIAATYHVQSTAWLADYIIH